MDHIRLCLSKHDVGTTVRSVHQRNIQQLIQAAIARFVYGPTKKYYEREIKKHNKFKDLKQLIAITMPRRAGKTTGVAQVIAAILYCVPNADVAIFAASKRAAGRDGLMGQILTYLKEMYDVTEFDQKTMEVIKFRVDGNVRILKAYPGAVHTLRGVGAPIIVIDEFAYVKEKMFTEVILPLLILEHTCLICLSTMGENPANIFTKIIESGIMKPYVMSFVCANCERLGKPEQCTHKSDSLPHWMSEGNMSNIKQIYSLTGGGTEQFNRETLGYVNTDESNGPYVFKKQKVNELFSNPRYIPSEPIRYLFMIVDPCGGSDDSGKRTSDFAVVTIGSPGTTIYGMEAIDAVVKEDYERKLIDHVERVRSNPYTSCAVIVLDVESGTGFEAGNIQALITERFNNVITMNDYERKPGTSTTNKAKKEMVELTTEVLNTGDVRIVHPDHFVTSHRNQTELLTTLKDQMLKFARYVRLSETPHQANRIVFSGKGERNDQRDDLSMCFIRAIRSRTRFHKEPKYAPHRH